MALIGLHCWCDDRGCDSCTYTHCHTCSESGTISMMRSHVCNKERIEEIKQFNEEQEKAKIWRDKRNKYVVMANEILKGI